MTLADRFWEKVDRGDDDECWEWTGSTAGGGYGQISVDGENQYVHRVAMKLNGTDLGDKQVNHTCDKRTCVNPAHLYLGTQSENVQDMYDRGREGDRDYVTGTDHPRGKLSEDDVETIRSSDAPRKELADRFDVHPTTISKVKHGVWRPA